MNRNRMTVVAGCVAVALVAAPFCLALVTTDTQGRWPKDWPAELEPLRGQSRTIGVATGIQQNIYEITFSDRDTFEDAWPVILEVKTKGAPLTLYRVETDPPKAWGPLLSNEAPAVRIYAPSDGYAGGPSSGSMGDRQDMERLVAEGKMLRCGPPWPEEIVSPAGELPEYVVATEVDGTLRWIEGRVEDRSPGFLERARVDIELVVDGDIIDLNRIPLPADTPVVDKRF